MNTPQENSAPASTPEKLPENLLEQTLGKLVAQRPGRARVFQDFKLDFCCQGGRTLAAACAEGGLDPQPVLERLREELSALAAAGLNPATLSLPEMADYIVAVHHAFLRHELPRLDELARKVLRVHGETHPELGQIKEIFCALEAELIDHLAKEEQILFPAIQALARAETPALHCGLEGPIAQMIHEHDGAGAALHRLRELSGDFTPPESACSSYRALFAGLAELEADLHRHIHLENSVLFPRAKALAPSI